MKRTLYCIRDNLSGFGTPVFDVSDQTAKRAFSYAINNNADMNFSPSDYDLYKVGTFARELLSRREIRCSASAKALLSF